MIGLYVTAGGAATADRKPNSVATFERCLSALGSSYTQRGQSLDRRDQYMATALAGIRNTHAQPPRQKEAMLPEDVIAMLETLERASLRGLLDRATGKGKEVGPDRLSDNHVARLVKQAALAASVRADLPEGERANKFAGHSLRAGLASSAEVDEHYVQKQLGHTSAEVTRR